MFSILSGVGGNRSGGGGVGIIVAGGMSESGDRRPWRSSIDYVEEGRQVYGLRCVFPARSGVGMSGAGGGG